MTSVSTRRVKALPILIWGYITWSLVPVLIAVIYSFNDGRSRTVWKGFSFRWWFGDKYASVFHDDSMRQAIVNSLVLATTTMLIVTPLGLALAIGSHRLKGKSATAVQGMTSIPLITPEIVVGRVAPGEIGFAQNLGQDLSSCVAERLVSLFFRHVAFLLVQPFPA